MSINKEFVVDTEQLVEDYRHFLHYINKYFEVKISFPGYRVLEEILLLHIKGTLDNRIFNMFRQLTEDWERKFIDLLTDEKLNTEEVTKLLNSVRYRDLRSTVESVVRHVYQGQDPNFTIWEVDKTNDLSCVIIYACGDYRIEQWHHEHHVTKLEIKDVISYDMSHLAGFIRKTFAYTAAPSRLKLRVNARSKVDAHKSSFFSEMIKNYIGFKLDKRKTDEERFLTYVDHLGKEMIVNPLDIEAKLQALDSFFNLEVVHQLDKMSNFKQVTSFTISGEEIIINFGSHKSNERKTLSYEELELAAAEANGDYIPERLRKHRG